MTPPHLGLWTCLKTEKANRWVLRWSQCNSIRGKLFYEIYNVDNKGTSPHFMMCTMAPGCNASVWPERVSAGAGLTFTSSHMALSSVRTRVVWSGVEGTTMDFCRVKTPVSSCANTHQHRKWMFRCTRALSCARTLIQGWFINCVMVILSLGSVFRRRWIRFLATKNKRVKKIT